MSPTGGRVAGALRSRASGRGCAALADGRGAAPLGPGRPRAPLSASARGRTLTTLVLEGGDRVERLRHLGRRDPGRLERAPQVPGHGLEVARLDRQARVRLDQRGPVPGDRPAERVGEEARLARLEPGGVDALEEAGQERVGEDALVEVVHDRLDGRLAAEPIVEARGPAVPRLGRRLHR
ncbi:MAG: hypothetical protein M9894_08150 [Planctomycetes bacterium]|nr:hypothetical protein [Planctomycetota bacterium]